MIFEVIEHKYMDEWHNKLSIFSKTDIYYLPEYFSEGLNTTEGLPSLVFFEGDNGMRLVYVVQQFDIAKSALFSGLQANTYFDWTTPYGYGGPLVEQFNIEDMDMFFAVLTEWCQTHIVVSQFIRFHPLFANHTLWEGHCNLKLEKNTVAMDVSSRNQIWENLDSKNRNMIRKAEKNGVQIIEDPNFERFGDFLRLYETTMDRRSASEFYYFTHDYFLNLIEALGSHLMLFHAMYRDEVIASTLILTYQDIMHYHLSGADRRYLMLAPNNLLLYTIANYGADRGKKVFHLGGGLESGDSLFSFKKSFNKKGIMDFFIGANVFCDEEYIFLLEYRKQQDPSFSGDGRMIQYRKGE